MINGKTYYEIIKDLTFNMNLNPMTNNHINLSALLNSSNTFNEAVEMIINIKKCLYDGFKFNIAIYNKELNKYIIKNTQFEINTNSYLTKNLPILESGKKFEINKPPVILFDSSIIKNNPEINNYQFYIANSISVLSGYININRDILPTTSTKINAITKSLNPIVSKNEVIFSVNSDVIVVSS